MKKGVFMEIQCKICHQLKKSPYKYVCRNCYQKQWIKTIPEKVCQNCLSIFKNSGNTCGKCNQKKRHDNSRKLTCSNCHRTGLIISDMNNLLCTKCHRHKEESLDPAKAQRRKDINLISHRKKKGKDLNAPRRKSTGEWKNSQGYVIIYKKDHPNAFVSGCLPKHVFVMSEHIGRPLKKGENVHHINGIRDDNRIENLELWRRGQCTGQRLKEKLEWCKELLIEYGYKIIEP